MQKITSCLWIVLTVNCTMSVVLATAGYDHMIRFWEAPTGLCIRVIKFTDSQVNRLEITPDKQFIAAAGNPHVRLYEIQGGGASRGSSGNNASGGGSSALDPAVLALEGHTGNVTSLGFHKDGRYLYTGSEDGTLKVWDLSNPYCSRSFDVGAPVNSVCLRTDRDEFITGDQNGFVKIWDLGGSGSKGGLIHSAKPSAPASPFGSMCSSSVTTATGSSNRSIESHSVDTAPNKEDGTNPLEPRHSITGRNPRQNQQPYGIQGHRRYAEGTVPIQAIDISEDSRTLVAVTNRGTVYVWDPSSNSNLSLLQSISELQDPADPDASFVPPTSSDGCLRPITKFRAHTERPGTYCLHGKIAPDCRHLVTTASDGTAKLWDTTTWELTQTLVQQPMVDQNRSTNNSTSSNVLSKWVWDAAFCADSSYLVTASSDRVARLWNLRTGDVVRQYHGHLSAVTCVALNDSSVE
jgi:target of rapamycin complex subunit LST8